MKFVRGRFDTYCYLCCRSLISSTCKCTPEQNATSIAALVQLIPSLGEAGIAAGFRTSLGCASHVKTVLFELGDLQIGDAWYYSGC